MTQQRRNELSNWISPALLAIIAFMMKNEYASIKNDLNELRKSNEIKTEMLIEIRTRVGELERRITKMEGKHSTALFRHEEIFTLNNKKRKYAKVS